MERKALQIVKELKEIGVSTKSMNDSIAIYFKDIGKEMSIHWDNFDTDLVFFVKGFEGENIFHTTEIPSIVRFFNILTHI